MRIQAKVFAAAISLSLLSGSGAFARDDAWDKDHPRRAEVNGRLNNQNKRIQEGEKDGSLSKGQARQLHQEDRHIRKEERHMAAKDGGHLTRKDQARLNRQENKASKQIHAEKHAK